MKKDVQILIRLDRLEKLGFERAAEITGIGLSAWARSKLRSAAIRELENAGELIGFIEKMPSSIDVDISTQQITTYGNNDSSNKVTEVKIKDLKKIHKTLTNEKVQVKDLIQTPKTLRDLLGDRDSTERKYKHPKT